MKLWQYILFPFLPIYFLVVWIRNKLYDFNIKSSKAFNFPVICVGNLSVGGTGKSPMIEYLVNLLKSDYNVAILSRGYKRKSKGFILASNNANAQDLGDEPFQFYSKFKHDKVQVAVDANRLRGIKTLQQIQPPLDIILLDDAFQHRKVVAGFNILLTTYENLYVDDWLLPTGNLREPQSGAKRAQCIVVTKCPPDILVSKKQSIAKRLKLKPYQTLFFSSIVYADIVYSKKTQKPLKKLTPFTLVTGIANASPLVNYLTSKNLIFEHLEFSDHYNFTQQDIEGFKLKSCLLTTEKDYMRLQVFSEIQDKLFYLPIHITIDKTEKFKKTIQHFLKMKKT